MNPKLEAVRAAGIVPVIKIQNAADAVPLAEALLRGGIACGEVTFRTPAAEEAMRSISNAYPDFLLGAGTVLNEQQAAKAVTAGAAFIVSPGFNESLVKFALKENVLYIPGVSTPTEIEAALSYGLQYLKFFPAEASGGLPMLKAMSAPYGEVQFMPTGGINLQNVKSYLQCKSVFACGGSWLCKEELIEAGDFEEITKRTQEAAQLVLEVRA